MIKDESSVIEAILSEDKVFISYSRANTEFVEPLYQTLAKKYQVWMDVHSILAAEPWSEAIYEALDSAQTVLCILTLDSVKSDICSKEIERAFSNKKNVVPIVIGTRHTVEGIKKACNDAWKITYEKISKLNYVFFDNKFNNPEALIKVQDVITSDPQNTRYQAILLVAARKWHKARVDNRKLRHPDPKSQISVEKVDEESLLFTGGQLRKAENWLEFNPTTAVHIQKLFVKVSQLSEQKRNRFARSVRLSIIGLVVVGLVIGAIAIATEQQRQEIEQLKQIVTIQNEHSSGNYFYGIEEFAKTVTHYTKAFDELKKNPEMKDNPAFKDLEIDFAAWYNELAVACMQTNDSDCAIESATKAIEIEPKYPGSYLNRAIFYSTMQPPNYEMANADLMTIQIIKKNDDLVDFQATRIRMLMAFQQSQWQDVIDIYSESEKTQIVINNFDLVTDPKIISPYALDIVYFLGASYAELNTNSCVWWRMYQSINTKYTPVQRVLGEQKRAINAYQLWNNAGCI